MEDIKLSRNSGILLSLSKLFFTLILFYMGWFQWVFFTIPNLTLALGAGMLLFIIYHSLIYRNSMLNGVTSELLVWFIFSLTSLLTG
ncbi:hypothetical protein, partial [Peribacillus simplex]|uniref:hypothetical protein n=1 Tax=Peribacillus simplex TaxID=1478 RepID=UPI001A91FB4F